jgi:membrane glycosyltransferase
MPTARHYTVRRMILLSGVVGLSLLGGILTWRTFLPDGISGLEGMLLTLFALLFPPIAFGFSLAFTGALQTLRGGDPLSVTRVLDDATEPQPLPATAITLPVFNEDIPRVFAGLEAMLDSLERAGAAESFDFFILSDSNNPDQWIAEEAAWFDLCRRRNLFGRVFYRKRRVPRNGKSGNIADFCRRWGGRYRYMVVLDADSIMAGETLVRLVQMMERLPSAGIIQTAPRIVGGETLFQRLIQFTARLCGPVFCAGSNFWQMSGGNFWGHNAIIRLAPFIQHCGLPDLPGETPISGRILSHDTVEAALMRKAGYAVWLAYDLDGSYEDGPPTLTDTLKRDRRWCQGNLQHFWFLFAKGLRAGNRVHILNGLAAYLTAPLWLLMMLLGAVDFTLKQNRLLLTSWTADGAARASVAASSAGILIIVTVIVLFGPKLISLAATLAQPKLCRAMGGPARLILATLLETVWSMALAPILAIRYTEFVLLTLLGRKVRWGTQRRSADGSEPWSQTLRDHALPTFVGLATLIALCLLSPNLLAWYMPVIIGPILAAPLARWTASPTLGAWARRMGLFLVPEETEPAQELDLGLDAIAERIPPVTPLSGLRRAVIDPYVHSLHISLLRQRRHDDERTEEVERLADRLVQEGPEQFTAQEQFAILWDWQILATLHRRIWTTPAARMHPWWVTSLRTYNEAQASASRFIAS